MKFRNNEHKTPIYPKFSYDDPYQADSYYGVRNIKLEMRNYLYGIWQELCYDINNKKDLCKVKIYEGPKKIFDRPPYIEFILKTGSGIREWIVKLQCIYLADGLWFQIFFPFNDERILIRPKDLFRYDMLAIMRGFIDSSLYEHGLGGEHKPTCFQIPDKYNLYLKLLNKKIIKKYNPEKAFEE